VTGFVREGVAQVIRGCSTTGNRRVKDHNTIIFRLIIICWGLKLGGEEVGAYIRSVGGWECSVSKKTSTRAANETNRIDVCDVTVNKLSF
jgi:hypothetical protein